MWPSRVKSGLWLLPGATISSPPVLDLSEPLKIAEILARGFSSYLFFSYYTHELKKIVPSPFKQHHDLRCIKIQW